MIAGTKRKRQTSAEKRALRRCLPGEQCARLAAEAAFIESTINGVGKWAPGKLMVHEATFRDGCPEWMHEVGRSRTPTVKEGARIVLWMGVTNITLDGRQKTLPQLARRLRTLAADLEKSAKAIESGDPSPFQASDLPNPGEPMRFQFKRR